VIKILLTIVQINSLWRIIKRAITEDIMSEEDDKVFMEIMEKLAHAHDLNKKRKYATILFGTEDATMLWTFIKSIVDDNFIKGEAITASMLEIMSLLAIELDKQTIMDKPPLRLV